MIARQFSLLFAANLLNAALRVAIVAAITNFYAPHEADVFLFLLTGAYFAAVISDFGLRTRLVSDATLSDGRERLTFLATAYRYRMVMGLLAGVGYIGWAVLAVPELAGTLLVVGLAVYGVLMPQADPSGPILRAREQSNLAAGLQLSEGVMIAIAVTLLLLFNAAVEAVAWSLALIGLGRFLLGLRCTEISLKSRFSAGEIAAMFRLNLFSGVSLLILTSAQRLPALLAAGLYTLTGISALIVAISLTISVQLISTSYAHIVMPGLARAAKSGGSLRIFGRNVSLMVAVGILCGGCLLLLQGVVEDIFNVRFPNGVLLPIALALPFSMAFDYSRFQLAAVRMEKLTLLVQTVGLGIFILPVVMPRWRDSFADFATLFLFNQVVAGFLTSLLAAGNLRLQALRA